VASVISLAGVHPSEAVLWQTEAQLTAQYGEPVDIRREDIERKKRVFTYQAGDLKVEVEFGNGGVQRVRYVHKDETKPFSAGEIEALLRENSQGNSWRSIDKEQWELGVPAMAEASLDSLEMTVQSSDGPQPPETRYWLEIATNDAQSKSDWLDPWIAKAKRFFRGSERRFTGVLELKYEKDENVVAIVRDGGAVLEIPWSWKGYPGKARLNAGKTYEITVREEDPVDLDVPMVFLSDRVHESHGARVVDSDGWFTLVRIRDHGEVIFDEAICELHHTRMEWKKAEIGYGLYAPGTAADAFCDRNYPHHANWIRGGCIQGDEKTASHYVCNRCVAETAKYKRENPDENKSLYPEEATQSSGR
jgi:hypothetical protein